MDHGIKEKMEQPGWRKKEPAFDDDIFKNLVGFFCLGTLLPESWTVLSQGRGCIHLIKCLLRS